jgi:hypothetical protein
MNIAEKFGLTPLIGTAGAIGTWTISLVNEYMAFAIGVATLVYTIGKCVDLFRNMK